MQVQVNTDNHIQGSDELSRHVQTVVEGTLERFADRITRVEVHLTDENSSTKSGDNDKRCAMEARLGGLPPIAVTHTAATLDQAIDGAVERLERTLDRTLGRKDDQKKGRTSMAGDQEV